MYVSLNNDKTIWSESKKEGKQTRCCSGSSSNVKFITFDLYASVSSLVVRFAQFLIESSKHILLWSFFWFCLSCYFIIIVIWWVRWIWQRRIWQNWIWIWVIWYAWYRIGWVVACSSISFRCKDFFLWVMWWWLRVTCCPISKYWWSGQWIRCMYQM